MILVLALCNIALLTGAIVTTIGVRTGLGMLLDPNPSTEFIRTVHTGMGLMFGIPLVPFASAAMWSTICIGTTFDNESYIRTILVALGAALVLGTCWALIDHHLENNHASTTSP